MVISACSSTVELTKEMGIPILFFKKKIIRVLLKFRLHSVKLLNLFQSRYCELDKRGWSSMAFMKLFFVVHKHLIGTDTAEIQHWQGSGVLNTDWNTYAFLLRLY